MTAHPPDSTAAGETPAIPQAGQRRSIVRRWWRDDLLVISALVFILIAGAVFFVLADGFLLGEQELARALLFGLPEPFDSAAPTKPRWLADMARDVSALGSVEIVAALTAAALGYLVLGRHIGAALFVTVSVGAGTLGGYLLKSLFERLRPHHLTEPSAGIANTSFPSGHAMLAALIYLSLGVIVASRASRRCLRLYVLALSASIPALVGVSRVYIGVHWPTDVVAGWALGAGWVTLCWLGARVLTGLPAEYR